MDTAPPENKNINSLWGILLLAAGVLLLLNNFGVLTWDWHMAGRLWPMVFVMWGISALRISDGAKKTIIIVAVILTGFLLVSFSHGMPWTDRGWYGMRCPWY